MRFGGLVAINDLSFQAGRSDITALIGPNGAGKTTVFNCITGFYKPSEGMLTLRQPSGATFLLERLPGHVRKVAWIDSDVLFENPDWAALTSRSLDEYTVVQPFQQLVHLSPGRLVPDDDAEAIESFASVYSSDAGACRWSHFGVHGHTGMAWAARAEVLRRHGLFQVQLSGGADHFMAHAVTGSFESPCFTQARFTPLYKEFREWAKHFYADVGGRLGFVEGRCLHLWHGVREARRYNSVLREMLSLDFRPGRDVFVGENGLLTWSGRNMPLQRWAEQYFWDRSEDLLPQ